MFRFRYRLLVIGIISTYILGVVGITPSKRVSSSKGVFQSQAIKDVEVYASDLEIDINTAIHQLSLQELAGDLDAKLSREEDYYAGLWIQNSPQFRIVVQTTIEGREIIYSYIEESVLADFVEIRTVEYSLSVLKTAQVELQLSVCSLGVPTNSGINLIENKVELYTVERSQFESALKDKSVYLPPQVKIIEVNELGAQETDIYAGLKLSACTSGFSVVNSYGVKGILTAAHCPNTISYNGIDLPFQGSAFGGPYEYQWHTAPGFDVRNLAYDGTNNRYIFSTKHRDNQPVGKWVCKYGAATGYTCGYIIDKYFNPGGAMNNTLIRVHRDGYDLSEVGDSGGPWFSLNTAYGLHVGGVEEDAYYMAINYVDFLDLSVLTNSIYLSVVMKEQNQPTKLPYDTNETAYPSPKYDEFTNKSSSSPYP